MSGLIILFEITQRNRDEQRNLLRVQRCRLRDGQNPFEMTTDEHFMDLYRFPKSLCLELIDELKPFLPSSTRKHAISSTVAVLSAFRFFATYVWRRSRACRNLEELYDTCERNFWLMGDSGYPLHPWLMTPISAANNLPEERYNVSHKSTRALVERCIGILKSRFRCLSKERAIFFSPPCMVLHNYLMVLHNYLIRRKVPLQEVYLEDSVAAEIQDSGIEISTNNILNIGKRQRTQIVQDAFTNVMQT